jgi:hypothetical protein
MQNKNEGKICYADVCEYNSPVHRPHIHVMTNNGGYVKFIIEKPKMELRSITDADTR